MRASRAFFKGGPARVLRSSPQFGFTLAAYEVLQGILPMPGGAKEAPHVGTLEPKARLSGQEGPMSYLRSRNALKIILDLDEGFGSFKGPSAQAWASLPKIVGGAK